MKYRMFRVMAAAGLGLLLAGCNSMAADPIAPATLDGTAWILAQLPGRTLIEHTSTTLQFAGDRASGSDGCNRFSGTYESSATELRFSQLAGTKMACPGVMEQADAVTQALTATRAYRIDGERLHLLAADGTTIASYVAQATGIAGTSWIATGINNGKGGVASPVADTEVTLAFDTDGRATGSAGCNRFASSYAVDGNSITFGSAAATRKMCVTPGVMEQEQAFLDALGKVTAMRMEADRLELRGADSALAAMLQRVEGEP